VAIGPVEGEPQRPRVGERLQTERAGRLRVADDDLVAEALDERSGDGRGHRRDEAHPVGEARCHDRHRDHQAPQAAQPGVRSHHVAIGQHVGATDLDDARDLGVVGRPDQVVEHVADADGLAARGHPAGGDHDGQPLGEMAEDLERGAAGADDHGGAELGDGHAVRGQLGARRVAAGQMVRQARGVVTETAEEDMRDTPAAAAAREKARAARRSRSAKPRSPAPIEWAR
jgi:hypothetical protein